MDHRSMAQLARIVLHTIVCERALVSEAYIAPKEFNGLLFPQCTDQHTVAYIDDVVWTLKAVLRTKGQVELRMQVFGGSEMQEEWTLELQIGHMATSDVQAVLHQIAAASSYLPSLDRNSTFKVAVLLDRALPLPSKCRVASVQPPPLADGATVLHELPLLRVRVKSKSESK